MRNELPRGFGSDFAIVVVLCVGLKQVHCGY